MNKNEHLTKEGLIKIVKLKSFLNKGISKELRNSFPKIKTTILLDKLRINEINNINYH
jgi:hypothetical protein